MSRSGALPTTQIREWVRLVIGFGVSVAIGLAPLLGTLNLPLFNSLLSLYPETVKKPAIVIGSACIGVVAVLVEWNGRRQQDERWVGRQFARAIGGALTFIICLAVAWNFCVAQIPIPDSQTAYVVVGFTEPANPPCEKLSKSECVARKLTTDPSAIETYWGSNQLSLARLLLQFSYWGFLSSFGVMIGILMLRRPSTDAQQHHV
jgi:hypothetical protein